MFSSRLSGIPCGQYAFPEKTEQTVILFPLGNRKETRREKNGKNGGAAYDEKGFLS